MQSDRREPEATAVLPDQPLPPPPPPPPAPVDFMVMVSVSADRMTAECFMAPAKNGGAAPSVDAIREALTKKGVVAGISEETLTRMTEAPKYGLTYIVAQGSMPVPGKNAELTYQIRTKKDLRPHENEDGSVDYKDLGVVQNVTIGDVLCVKTPATPGIPGVTVLGSVLPAAQGKDVALPVGKNTVLSEDKLTLLAAITGQADVVNGKIHVLNTFTVRGDVCNATGNITFVGNVVVTGSVLSGFSVKATGNIDINGSVEAAVVSAGGNVILREGINGLGKGVIKAGGNVRSKYIQSGTVQAGGDVESTFIINSNVQSGGSVIMRGTKATLVGGRATASKTIEAVYVGGKKSPIPTVLEVGNDPSVLARSREIPGEIATAVKDINALGRAISLFEQHEKAGRLTQDKLVSLNKARDARDLLAEHMRCLEDERDEVANALANYGFGFIKIMQSVYAGVRVIIGSEHMLLESQYDHCVFERTEEAGLHIRPYR